MRAWSRANGEAVTDHRRARRILAGPSSLWEVVSVPTRVPRDPVAVALVATPFIVAALGSRFTLASLGSWYRRLDKPAWNPPDRVFGPVWTALYLLMGIAAVRVWQARRGGRDVGPALALYAVQLGLNLAWSWLFFDRRRLDLALADIAALDVAIAGTALAFGRVRPEAGLLLVPYLAWSTFATVLNAEIARRNDGRPR
jgi:tryptophan-rich sensory protein